MYVIQALTRYSWINYTNCWIEKQVV